MGVCGDGAEVRASIDRASSLVRGPRAWRNEVAGSGMTCARVQRGYILATQAHVKTGCIAATRCCDWRARQDLNPRPPGS